MSASEQVEIELKFDVPADHPVPDLTRLPAVAATAAPQEFALHATYFDTETLDLASNRMTLRRRTGGTDEGWHLKQPGVTGLGSVAARREIRLGFDEAPADGEVPDELLTPVLAITRRRRLIPVAAISTSRTVTELFDDAGRVVAVMCEDLVTAQSLLPEGTSTAWSEWEFELVNGTGGRKGDRKLLDAARKLLRAAGATTSASGSKLARAIGSTPFVGPPHLSKNPTALELLITDIAVHRNAMVAIDPLVRADADDAVHQMRVATRRLRSVLSGFPSVLDADRVRGLADELRLLSRILGAARDSEVQLALAGDMLSGEKASDVLFSALIGAETHSHHRAVEYTKAAMNSDRYFALLDAIDEVIAAPPAGPDADAPARAVVDKAMHRIRKQIRAAQDELARRSEGSADWDEQLHEIRKRAKRLRYAAEAAQPLNRKEYRATVRAAKKVQASLGEYNDSRINRARLATLAADSDLDRDDMFVLGRLDARQQHDGARALHTYWRAATDL